MFWQKIVGFDSEKLFFPKITQAKSTDLYSKASLVTRKRNLYNTSKSQSLTFSYSSSFLYISDLYWTDTRTHFGCNIAHICIRAAERGYIYGKNMRFFNALRQKKSSFDLYGETVSYHIWMMLVLFLRVKEFTKHVIYRKTPPNQSVSHINQCDLQGFRDFVQNEHLIVTYHFNHCLVISKAKNQFNILEWAWSIIIQSNISTFSQTHNYFCPKTRTTDDLDFLRGAY